MKYKFKEFLPLIQQKAALKLSDKIRKGISDFFLTESVDDEKTLMDELIVSWRAFGEIVLESPDPSIYDPNKVGTEVILKAQKDFFSRALTMPESVS